MSQLATALFVQLNVITSPWDHHSKHSSTTALSWLAGCYRLGSDWPHQRSDWSVALDWLPCAMGSCSMKYFSIIGEDHPSLWCNPSSNKEADHFAKAAVTTNLGKWVGVCNRNRPSYFVMVATARNIFKAMEMIREQSSRCTNGYQYNNPEGFSYIDIPGQAQQHQIGFIATIDSDILELNRRWQMHVRVTPT